MVQGEQEPKPKKSAFRMPPIENRISLGNLIQIGAMLVTITGAFVFVQAQTSANAAAIQDHEERIRTLEKVMLEGIARIDQRLSVIEGSTAPRRD